MHFQIGRWFHRVLNAGPTTEELKDVVKNYDEPTILWSAKEAVFKWYGDGGVDFRKQIQLLKRNEGTETINCFFSGDNSKLLIHYRHFNGLVLAWVVS